MIKQTTQKVNTMEHKDSFMRFAVISAIVLVGALGLFVHFHS